MGSKALSLLVMGALSLVVMSFIDLLIARSGALSFGLVAVSWTVDLVLFAIIAWTAASSRASWAIMALVNGAVCVILGVANTTLLASAAAPFESGSQSVETLVITLPYEPRLREALASAYFSMSIVIAGMILFAAAYLLWHRHNNARHPQ